MALQKTKTLKNNSTGNYWKIHEAVLSSEGRGYTIIALYKDKATRDNPEKTWLTANNKIDFEFTKEELEQNNIYALIYEKIKEEDFFVDAVDV